MPESLPMNGGNGIYSYSKNSQLQKEGSNIMMEMIKEAIIENMNIKSLLSSAKPNNTSFHIVDFGCSIGPNTFIAMQHIIEATTQKYQIQHKDTQISLEFQVSFNDHITNDFNTLFNALPDPERRYFASAVPGSFYGRLFPSRSIHIAYSCYSLQWLSKTPEDEKSPSWNKGRIHYIGASKDVTNAYVAQFEKDMEVFLNARAMEIVENGMIVMILPGIHSELDHSQVAAGFDVLKFFESSLNDMINEGILEEALVDSFNVPLYVASPKDMTKVVKKNGYFIIEKMEIKESQSKILDEADAKSLIIHLRATLEGIFTKHFGVKITDEMFKRTMEKSEEISSWMKVEYKKASQLFVVLKRK